MSDRNAERDDDELNLTCRSCGHAWPARSQRSWRLEWRSHERLPRRVTLEQWIAVQEAQACGQCGAGYRVSSWGRI